MGILNLHNIVEVNDNMNWEKQKVIKYAEFSICTKIGKRYIHIQTFGSPDRLTHPKPSQDLVFEIEEFKKFIKNL